MTEIKVLKEDIDISGYHLVEGLPGVGLVAKISSDYMIDQLGMETYAEVFDSSLSKVVVFERDDPELKSAMRIMVSEEHRIAVLKSDAPISAEDEDLVNSLIEWIDEKNLKPIFQVGLPMDVEEGDNYMFYIETGEFLNEAKEMLNRPPVAGGIGGPTGALLDRAVEKDLDSLTLVVESDPNFPDPAAASVLIDEGDRKSVV